MRRVFLFLVLWAAFTLGLRPLASQESQASEPSLESQDGDKKDLGSIVFFPGAESRPSNDRHSVSSGQTVSVCVKLSDQAPEYLQNLKKYTVGFRLILEDNQQPPQVLTVAWGDWLKWLRPDAQGCYLGSFRLSPTVKSGVYQVADLLIATNDYNYYSLRDLLYDFGQVDEMEVKNPADDLQAPELLSISTYSSPKSLLKMGGGVMRARVQQVFTFKEEGAGIDKKSVRVFYQLRVDGDSKGFKEAKCRKRSGTKGFLCNLELREPFFEWSLRQVSLELNAVRLRDKAGNLTFLTDPKLFTEKAGGTPLRFEFNREGRWFVYKPKVLKEQKLF